MKLATFKAAGHERIGVVKGDEIVDLTGEDVPSGMIELIANWPKHKDTVARIAAQSKPRYKIADVHLKAPVPRPPKIMAIGLNYADHIAETGREKPTQPGLVRQDVECRERSVRPHRDPQSLERRGL